MHKKTALAVIAFIILITLTACPGKEQTEKQDTTEKVPNTMHKASDELEQIITLLGGPLFNGRDNIEQMKNEQMQMLLESIQKYSLGTQDKEQVQPDSGTEKDKQQEDSKSQQDEQKAGQEKEKGNKEEQEGQSKQGGEQEEKESSSGSEPTQESGGEQDSNEKTEKDIENENSGENEDAKKPSNIQDKTFQYEDSLFGIPQWHEDNWKMIKVLTDGMHFTWNNLQPELIKKGVSQNQIENFNKALIALSQNVNEKNIKESQISAFQLSQALSDFYSYYKTEVPAELQRITSGVTGIHFYVKQNNWPQAQELANQLQQEFAKLKASIEDNQNHIFQMLELSVNDLCSAVHNQDSVLVMIRTNLVNANIRELDVKLSQNKE